MSPPNPSLPDLHGPEVRIGHPPQKMSTQGDGTIWRESPDDPATPKLLETPEDRGTAAGLS